MLQGHLKFHLPPHKATQEYFAYLNTGVSHSMTKNDHQVVLTALGFLATILNDNLAAGRQAERAIDTARLIEDFYRTTSSERHQPRSF